MYFSETSMITTVLFLELGYAVFSMLGQGKPSHLPKFCSVVNGHGY